MKNAIWYKDSWLMPNSKAYELYKEWQKTKATEDKKKLDSHCKEVDKTYKACLV